jgi:hypothetical protein
MNPTTVYIRPALTDQAGQCRIYATNGLEGVSARDDYEARPNLWREVGLMNSRGELVCFEGPDEWRQELIDCQPLLAGNTYNFRIEL